jgi:hypothetical protein
MVGRSDRVSLDAMWEHIELLATQHAFDTRVDRPADADAVPWARTIRIAPLRSVAANGGGNRLPMVKSLNTS